MPSYFLTNLSILMLIRDNLGLRTCSGGTAREPAWARTAVPLLTVEVFASDRSRPVSPIAVHPGRGRLTQGGARPAVATGNRSSCPYLAPLPQGMHHEADFPVALKSLQRAVTAPVGAGGKRQIRLRNEWWVW